MEFKDITKPLADVAQQYHFHKPPQAVLNIRDFIVHWLRVLHEFLRDLFHTHSGSLDSRSMSGFLQIIVVLTALAAVILSVYILAKRIAARQKEAVPAIRGADTIEENLDANGWKTQADKLARSQDYRGACRAVYLSLLQNMDEKQIAEFAPTKTNYEYAYALSKQPQLQQTFKRLAELVELVWFGNKQAEDSDYQQSVNYLQELDRQIQSIHQTAESDKARNGS